MRPLGLDLGTKRIGVAVADGAGTLATPYDTVLRSGDRARDHRRIAELAREVEADQLVVGLPLSLDGSVGPAAKAALKEVDLLARATGLPVDTWDERLTTVTAHHDLQAAGLDSKQRRDVVDKVAAAIMLQAWLDHRREAAVPPTPTEDPSHSA